MGDIICIECKKCIGEENSNELRMSGINRSTNNNNNNLNSLKKNESFRQTNVNDNFDSKINNIDNNAYKDNNNDNYNNDINNNNNNNGNNINKDNNEIEDIYENADNDKLVLINNMISCPEDYQRTASERKNDINEHFEKRIDEREQYNEYVNVINTDKNLRKLVRDYFLDKKNNDKSNDEKEKDIENIIKKNTNKNITLKLFLQIICEKDVNVEENVWRVLEENPDKVYNILKSYEEIIIVTLPINDKNIITYYFFYNFN